MVHLRKRPSRVARAFWVGACPGEQERKCDMLITTAHLFALHELAASEAAGHAVRALTEDDPQEHIYRELELQGLVLLEVPRAYRLTYPGREALGLLEPMREAALLPPLDRLATDSPFLASQ